LRLRATAQGFTEVYNYSFVSDGQLAELGLDGNAHLRVRNPISADQSLMRTSLLPGILRNLRDNMRNFATFRLFEIGHEIHPVEGELPNEVPHLAAALYSRSGDGESGLMELKRLAGIL